MNKENIQQINPEQLVRKMAGNNPILIDLIQKVQKGDTESVINFAKNIFREKGRDFDKEFSQFRSNFK